MTQGQGWTRPNGETAPVEYSERKAAYASYADQRAVNGTVRTLRRLAAVRAGVAKRIEYLE